MAKREAVTFENRDGLRLFGILHRPDKSVEKNVGIIFLSPGVKSRVGPHCLYNKMTNSLLEQGYPVLRFDFYGLGDSEGELSEQLLMDLYDTVQRGRYCDDTQSAIDWMQELMGLDRFVLAGLCGGALTGLLAATNDRRVEGLLALAIPVAFDAQPADASRYITSGQLNDMGAAYLRKLFKPSAWIRLLTFQTDYRILLRAVTRRLVGRAPRNIAERSSSNGQASNLNPYFVKAFFDFVGRGGKLLLVFGGSDRLAWEFEEKFAQPNAARLEQLTGHEVHTISKANHILSDTDHRREMQDLSHGWLARHF